MNPKKEKKKKRKKRVLIYQQKNCKEIIMGGLLGGISYTPLEL